MQVYRCPFPNIPRCANTKFGHKNSMKDHVLVNHKYFSTCESNTDMLDGTYTQTRMSVERWKSECIRRKKGDWRKFVQEALDAQLAAAQAVPVAPVLPSQAAAAPSPYLPPVPTELSAVVWEQAPEIPPYPAQTAHTGQIFHMPQYDHVTWDPVVDFSAVATTKPSLEEYGAVGGAPLAEDVLARGVHSACNLNSSFLTFCGEIMDTGTFLVEDVTHEAMLQGTSVSLLFSLLSLQTHRRLQQLPHQWRPMLLCVEQCLRPLLTSSTSIMRKCLRYLLIILLSMRMS